ncbi:MAG: right-handed parallel beta-helix repeat-containing protein [Abditibacteriaceae bacterium]
MKSITGVIGLLLLLALCRVSHAATYHVGAQRDIKTLSAISTRLLPGDVVDIDPGVYHEVLKLLANGTADAPIIIRGIGTARPIFDAQDMNVSGRGPIPRAIFQIEGEYLVIEHLEFKNARNGENAAGIRLLHSTNATIRDCAISNCDMGIFGDDLQTATIENCDVGFNSTKIHNGYAHNFYMSGNRVVVRGCRIHDCPFGQNFKSRAHYNELWYNVISNSNEGEVGIVDGKGDTDRPNSNSLLVGNVIVSPPNRTGNHWKFVLFGSELGNAHNGTLFLFHNILKAGDARIRFITLADAQSSLVARDNTFIGKAQVLYLLRPPVKIVANGNQFPTEVPAPPGWTDPADEPLTYIDGDGVTRTLVVDEKNIPAVP